jgi:predicted DNA-binding WGR domain protein
MSRTFINQTGESNKFWQIDQKDNSYIVTWGKIGTEGRSSEKTFQSREDCNKEVEKLIKEKLGKGYLEVSGQDNIPTKTTQEYERMDENVFWEIISSFNWKKTGDDDAVLRPAVKRLVSMTIDDIYKFADILAEKLYMLDGISYASNIGEEGYKGEDQHFSVDYFLYVRCCVVANGKDYFDMVVSNPGQMPKEMDFEPLLYLPMEAYNKKTKTEDYDYVTKYNYETFSNIGGWKKID